MPIKFTTVMIIVSFLCFFRNSDIISHVFPLYGKMHPRQKNICHFYRIFKCVVYKAGQAGIGCPLFNHQFDIIYYRIYFIVRSFFYKTAFSLNIVHVLYLIT